MALTSNDTYVLSEDTAKRLLRMLRWFERQPRGGPDGDIDGGGMLNFQFVELDGSAAVTSGGIDYYSGLVVIFNASSAAFTELGECWLIDANDTTLDTTGIYPCLQSGNVEVSSEERALFVTACGCP